MIFFDINEFSNHLKPGYRILGLDVGLVRVGVSLSDEGKFLATNYASFNLKKQKINFKEIFENNKICAIVIGYPLQMDGTEGKSCVMVHEFIKKHLLKLNSPIFLQDERFSTAAVQRYLKEMNFTRKQQVDLNDKAAASYILQAALDKLDNNLNLN
jgi:putative holliday junction resolvase